MYTPRRPLATSGEPLQTHANRNRDTASLTAGQIHDRLLMKLEVVLDEERRLSEQMFHLAQIVQRHILADECEQLLVTAQEQEDCVRQLAQAEFARLSLVRQLKPYYPRLADLRLSQWVDGLPEPHASQLRPISSALAKAALQVQRLNRQNKALIQRSLRFAELALGMEPATYGAARGRYAPDSDGPRLVDQTL